MRPDPVCPEESTPFMAGHPFLVLGSMGRHSSLAVHDDAGLTGPTTGPFAPQVFF